MLVTSIVLRISVANVKLDFGFDCSIDVEQESCFVDISKYIVHEVLRLSTPL